MKKIVASVGLVAIGASGLHAASVPSIVAEDTKPWTIAATLRGFYDDNINSASDAMLDAPGGLRDSRGKKYEEDSFGFEISPSILFNLPINQGQTGISLGYTYSLKYYENELYGTDQNDDQTHQFNLGLDHAFSERYSVSVKDSFVIGQDPDLIRTGNAMETFQRIPGDNIRNYGMINFDGRATRLFGYQVGYANSYFNYDADGETYGMFGAVSPSIGGLLDRVEHVAHLDGRWQVQPDTVGIVGYQFRQANYIGGEQIAGNTIDGYIWSDNRDSRSHYGYLGVDHTFRPEFTGALRVGAQYTDYFNDPYNDDQVTPYVLASLKYNYMPESFVELGFTHDINATDMIGYDGSDFTRDQNSSIVYLTLTHRITPRLFGSIIGQFQNSEFNGGSYDNESERFYSAGINLEYRFNRYFSGHVGYSYDALDSDLGSMRDMDRNRVYLGVTARY